MGTMIRLLAAAHGARGARTGQERNESVEERCEESHGQYGSHDTSPHESSGGSLSCRVGEGRDQNSFNKPWTLPNWLRGAEMREGDVAGGYGTGGWTGRKTRRRALVRPRQWLVSRTPLGSVHGRLRWSHRALPGRNRWRKIWRRRRGRCLETRSSGSSASSWSGSKPYVPARREP